MVDGLGFRGVFLYVAVLGFVCVNVHVSGGSSGSNELVVRVLFLATVLMGGVPPARVLWFWAFFKSCLF